MLKMCYDFQCILNGIVCFLSLYIYNRSDTAIVMFKSRVIHTERFSF